MDANKVKYLLIALIITVLTLSPLLYLIADKPSIHECTIDELEEIHGIGEYYSQEIYKYIIVNPNCTIEDLDDIYYLGDSIVKKLKERYK